jgi:drug/metabolite transporter (DMT)-like permease
MTPSMSDWLLFLAPSLIWGTTWLTIKFQLGAVAPELSVAYRFALASVMIFAWCAARNIGLRFDLRTHAKFAVQGLLQYALNYVLVYLAEGALTSGLVAVVFVLMVVWNLMGARLFFRRRQPWSIVAGAVVGMAGVALVFWPEVSHVRGALGEQRGIWLGVLATLVSSAGNLWSERMYTRELAVVPSTAWAMLYGAIGVAGYCAVRRTPFVFDASLHYVVSLAYLALFGSVFAFIAYLTLLRRVGSGRAGYTAVVTPMLAMLTSTVFEGYRWSAPAVAGMALVFSGNVLVLRGRT